MQMQNEILCLFDNMPEVEVWAKGTKDNKCVWCNAKYFSENCSPTGNRLIIFSPKFLYESKPSMIRNTMKHELIHAWLNWKGKPYSHNKEFFRKAIEVECDITRYKKWKCVKKWLREFKN